MLADKTVKWSCNVSPTIYIVKPSQNSSPTMSERTDMANSRLDLMTATNNDLDLDFDNPGLEDSSEQKQTPQPAEAVVSGHKRSAVVQFVVDDELEEETCTERSSGKKRNKEKE